MFHFLLFYPKRVVFLSQKTDNNRNDGDEHLTGRGIPSHMLHT